MITLSRYWKSIYEEIINLEKLQLLVLNFRSKIVFLIEKYYFDAGQRRYVCLIWSPRKK